MKIEKEEEEGGEPLWSTDYGIILWQCVKKEGREEDENRIRPLTLIPRRRRRPSSYFSFRGHRKNILRND